MSRRPETETVEVERTVDLPVGVDELWRAVTDQTLLGEWLGAQVDLDVRTGGAGRVVDDDGTVRHALVTEVVDGRSVTWHWWNERDGVSTVRIDLDERADGTSRLRVVESLGTTPSGAPPRAQACERRWERATSQLWSRVGVLAAR